MGALIMFVSFLLFLLAVEVRVVYDYVHTPKED